MPDATPFDLALNKALSLTQAYPSFAQPIGRRGRLRRLHDGSAFSDDDRSRIALGVFHYDMYRGNQLPFIEPHPGESDHEFSQRPYLRSLNLTRVAVDVLSGLYRSPVERRIEANDGWQGLFQQAWQSAGFDSLMSSVDRLTRLQGTCALQPVWQEDQLNFRIFPGHRLAVLRDPADPEQALAVITLSIGSLWDQRGEAAAASFADIWTATEYARVSGGKIVSRRPHPYGKPPFVFVRDRLAIDDFWVEGRGHSLCYDNAVLNGRLSDLAQVVAMQGFGVMEIINPDPTQQLALGPGRAVAFRVGSDMPFGINFKQPGAPIAELVNEIAESIRLTLLAQRIPEQALSVSVTSNASGVAIHAAGSPVLEDRIERVKLFSSVEQQLFECATVVASAHSNLNLNQRPRLRINFPEPDLARDLADRREQDQWMLERGMVTPWQLMLRDNPDGYASLDEAKAIWLAQHRELRDLGVIGEGAT